MAHMKPFEHLKIQLEAIKSATNNFSEESCIGRGGFGRVYKGKIAEHMTVAFKRLDPAFGQGDTEFWKEIMLLSLYKHENIVSLLGFCDDSNEKILVYEYIPNKSLDYHLNSDNLSWNKRLKICIGVARGLAYLHSGVGTQPRVFHRDIKSSNILLDEDWNAKISDFGLSRLGPANQEYTFLYSTPVGTRGYCDPLYAESRLLTKESDVYSFGVVLFEVLCGRLCIDNTNDSDLELIELVRKSYKEKTMYEIVYDKIKDEINPSSLLVFTKIAYQCLERNREDRPLMSDILGALETALRYQALRNDPVANSYFQPLKQSEHLKIQLDVIKSATNNFSVNSLLGRGGSGFVYKGMIAGQMTVALKRLDPAFSLGKSEFCEEVIMLSLYKHQNIVSLLGFCDDSGEKILVYPYVPNKSLEYYLNNDNLGWIRRLKICIGAARGLEYLYRAFGSQQGVLHRAIKSRNILIDEEWNAKISDFGPSKFAPADYQYTFLYSQNVGTSGYMDPLYPGLLTKEENVHSFGVVLFEVLCGRYMCTDGRNANPSLIQLAQQSYEHNTIKEIVYGNIKGQIDPDSLHVFATIAYRCLKQDREERPLLIEIVEALENALLHQEFTNDPVANNYFPMEDRAKAVGMASKIEGAELLVVTIHKGINLNVKHPYVSLRVGDALKFTTTKYYDQNPVWEEEFKFTLENAACLSLTVWSKSQMDKFLRKKILGTIKVDLKEVVKEKHMNNIYQIKKGELHVELQIQHAAVGVLTNQ